ncbi:DUF423 domain-containing protein [Luminiphilus sp.]|nr:DUF423 domain-containing protein [Luminiphilus sp.]
MRFSFVAIACFLAFVAVAFGAFGAHALESRVSLARVENWAVAVHYHSLHALAMIALSAALDNKHSVWLQRAQAFFVIGVCLFSGSLYLLVLTDTPQLGAVTPLGGVSLLAGWACAFFAAVQKSHDPDV